MQLIASIHANCTEYAGQLENGTATNLTIPDRQHPAVIGIGLFPYRIGDQNISENRIGVTLPMRKTATRHDFGHRFDIPPVIDYWSLDTEGSELMLLSSFPWDRYKVNLVTVEHNQEEPKRSKIRELLTAKGFKQVQIDHPYEDYYSLLT